MTSVPPQTTERLSSTCTVLVLFLCALLHAETTSLMTQAKTAEARGDLACAQKLYGQVRQKTTSQDERMEAIQATYRLLKKQKQPRRAELMVLHALDEDGLKPKQRRQLLNTLAMQHLWEPDFLQALALLAQARNMDCPKGSNVYFATYWYLATVFLDRMDLPDAAIEVLTDPLRISELHPANRFTAEMITARAWEKLGQNNEALNHYQLARTAGKKVTYRFDISSAEKAIRRLTK